MERLLFQTIWKSVKRLKRRTNVIKDMVAIRVMHYCYSFEHLKMTLHKSIAVLILRALCRGHWRLLLFAYFRRWQWSSVSAVRSTFPLSEEALKKFFKIWVRSLTWTFRSQYKLFHKSRRSILLNFNTYLHSCIVSAKLMGAASFNPSIYFRL